MSQPAGNWSNARLPEKRSRPPTRCASKDLSPRSWERADHRVLYFQLHDTTDPGVVTNPALRSTRHLLLAGWLSAGRCWADRCGWWGAGRQPEGEPVDQVSEDGCGDCWRGDDAHRARGHFSAGRAADGGAVGGVPAAGMAPASFRSSRFRVAVPRPGGPMSYKVAVCACRRNERPSVISPVSGRTREEPWRQGGGHLVVRL